MTTLIIFRQTQVYSSQARATATTVSQMVYLTPKPERDLTF